MILLPLTIVYRSEFFATLIFYKSNACLQDEALEKSDGNLVLFMFYCKIITVHNLTVIYCTRLFLLTCAAFRRTDKSCLRIFLLLLL